MVVSREVKWWNELCAWATEPKLNWPLIAHSEMAVHNDAAMTVKRTLALATTVLFLCPGMSAWAGDSRDHDRARQAVEAGEILPLRAILERVERDGPGQVIDVGLEQEGGHWIYEVKVLRPDGAMVKLRLDAKDATRIHGKDHDPTRHNGDQRRQEVRP
jgi:hypothetical protein